ncbi:MAG: hypothetical protein ABS45_10195 [Comamonas sp. SCN 65-56]|nr:MAG: hypothetical protein ABS45_10195 [Comamonas sp. SCN 65-56]
MKCGILRNCDGVCACHLCCQRQHETLQPRKKGKAISEGSPYGLEQMRMRIDQSRRYCATRAIKCYIHIGITLFHLFDRAKIVNNIVFN